MAIENPSSCPHCGGENGFHTKEVVDFKQFYAWDGTFLEGHTPSAFAAGEHSTAATAVGILHRGS